MGLPAYLRLIADRIEESERLGVPAEALRLIEITREELTDQVTQREAALVEDVERRAM